MLYRPRARLCDSKSSVRLSMSQSICLSSDSQLIYYDRSIIYRPRPTFSVCDVVCYRFGSCVQLFISLTVQAAKTLVRASITCHFCNSPFCSITDIQYCYGAPAGGAERSRCNGSKAARPRSFGSKSSSTGSQYTTAD